MQVITTKLPNGRDLHVPYSAVATAAMELYHAGQDVGKTPTGKRGVGAAQATIEYQRAKTRSETAFRGLETAIEAMAGQAVDHAWDAAIASLQPYKCGHCGARFEMAGQLISHAMAPASLRECTQALEMGLRLSSDWAVMPAKAATDAP